MSSDKIEFGNRKQYFYNLKPGSTLVYGKVRFGVGGTVLGHEGFHGVDNVEQLNPAAKTGLYRVEFTNRYLDLEGFWGNVTSAVDGDGYDVVLVKDQDFMGGTSEDGKADAYQDGYCQVQFFQGGTQKAPVNQTAFLHFIVKTSEQG